MTKPRLIIIINFFLILNLGVFIFGCSDDGEQEEEKEELEHDRT